MRKAGWVSTQGAWLARERAWLLGHGFHETKQGVRYTIGEAARREVLGRLLKLNHERYAEEVAQGLHEKGKPKSNGKRVGKRASDRAEAGLTSGRRDLYDTQLSRGEAVEEAHRVAPCARARYNRSTVRKKACRNEGRICLHPQL